MTTKEVVHEEIVGKGGTGWIPERSPHENRVSVIVTDSLGNTVRTEGVEKPEKTTKGSVFPDHPVKVGDTWSFILSQDGKETDCRSRLDRIETVGNVEYAVVSNTLSRSVNGISTDWISLETGLVVKSERKMKSTDDAGEPIVADETMHIVRPDGTPALP